jgi:hypothetical protein
VAAHVPTDDGECRGYGIMVLTVAGDVIDTVTGFPDAHLFPIFDLPAVRK